MTKHVEHVKHEFGPFYDKNSKVLILGTIPSPKSREMGFYYGHPRNRFWMIMSELLGEPFPNDVKTRKAMMRKHGIALWDVLASCSISGAEDASIRDGIPNDMNIILQEADIKAVFTTGKKAQKLYEKLCYPKCGAASICLPSTSPANCACSYEKLKEVYSVILEYI